VIVAGLTGRAGPIVFSPLPVSERRRMTNNADANQVVAFQRDPNGTLDNPHSYGTDGRGSGGTVDPLTSQGSLTLSADHAWSTRKPSMTASRSFAIKKAAKWILS
jgi:hypothetical protein